jgi:predicted nuclease of restriction endonuclease-like (RecB) superfamily
MLARGQLPRPEDAVSLEQELRDPYLLELANLKDEYSEAELEEALIRHLEAFLLELGAGFTFVARQKRIRVGDEWYRIDLLLFHRWQCTAKHL